ncbi:MAG: TrmH family RNA methyltransferase [Gemmatimonadales bacterium]
MALLSTIRDLHRRKGRERRGLALAEGVRLVEEMLAAGVPCKGVAIAPALESTPRGMQLHQKLTARGAPVETVSDADLVALAATEHPQGIVAVYEVRAWSLDELTPAVKRPVVVLDAVQDPGNVGTIARTAWAFGAAGIVALPGTADLSNPKAVRGAMGALFHLPHRHATDEELARLLTKSGAALWVTTLDGMPIASATADEPVALAFGNEGAGVRPELLSRASRRVTIPIRPGTESLNVAVAAGIALYQLIQ